MVKSSYLSNSISNAIYTRFRKWSTIVPCKFFIHRKLKKHHQSSKIEVNFRDSKKIELNRLG